MDDEEFARRPLGIPNESAGFDEHGGVSGGDSVGQAHGGVTVLCLRLSSSIRMAERKRKPDGEAMRN